MAAVTFFTLYIFFSDRYLKRVKALLEPLQSQTGDERRRYRSMKYELTVLKTVAWILAGLLLGKKCVFLLF